MFYFYSFCFPTLIAKSDLLKVIKNMLKLVKCFLAEARLNALQQILQTILWKLEKKVHEENVEEPTLFLTFSKYIGNEMYRTWLIY